MLKKAFAVAIALFLLLLCGCTVSTPVSETTESDKPSTLKVPFSLDECIFLGDSNIAHLSSYRLLPDNQIWTGSERYLTLEPDICNKYIVYPDSGTEMTIYDAVSLKKPKSLVITLGTDGALGLDRTGFRLSYISLIDSIKKASSETRILLQSIFPIRQALRNGRFNNVTAANEKFALANLWLEEIAEDAGILYLDTHSVLTDKDGMLRVEYNTDHFDGYHLNRDGLQAMLEYILKNVK